MEQNVNILRKIELKLLSFYLITFFIGDYQGGTMAQWIEHRFTGEKVMSSSHA